MDKITLGQYREHVRSHDWEAVYGDLYPDYDPQDEEYFNRCTEQDYDDGPDAWAFIDIKDESDEEPSYTANTFRNEDGTYRVEWFLESVGLVSTVEFPTYEGAVEWFEAENFQDFSS